MEVWNCLILSRPEIGYFLSYAATLLSYVDTEANVCIKQNSSRLMHLTFVECRLICEKSHQTRSHKNLELLAQSPRDDLEEIKFKLKKPRDSPLRSQFFLGNPLI